MGNPQDPEHEPEQDAAPSTAEILGMKVSTRRVELDMNQDQLAAAAGLSKSEIDKIENARIDNITPRTIRKLEHGLQWRPGSVQRIREGGEPELLSPSPAEVGLAALFDEKTEGEQHEIRIRIDRMPETLRLYGHRAVLVEIDDVSDRLRSG